MTKGPVDQAYAWAKDYIFTSEELRSSGVDLNYYPGAVFRLAKDDLRLLQVSRAGIECFKLNARVLKYLSDGDIKRVFFAEGLRKFRPRVEQLVKSDDPGMVVSSVLEYSAQEHPKYVYISLRLLPDMRSIFGLAQDIPPSVWPSNVIQTQARQFRKARLERFRSLTSREREVMRSMVEGLTNREISDELGISVNTVKTHKKNVHVKLDIAHPGDLIRYSVAFDLVKF